MTDTTTPEVEKTPTQKQESEAPALASQAPAASLPDWLRAVKPVGDVSRAPKSVMLYGRHGTRKTSMAKTLADVRNADGSFRFPRILFIDPDDGTEVIEDHYRDRISILPVRSAAQLEVIKNDLARTDLGFDAVVLDTLDVAQDLIEGDETKVFANNWDRWDFIRNWTESILRTMHGNPSYLGVTLVHSEEKKEKTGGVREAPKLSGKSNREVGAVPSTVIFLGFDDEGNHVGILGGNARLDAKNRYRLPNVIPEPDFVKFFKGVDKMIASGMVAPEADSTTTS